MAGRRAAGNPDNRREEPSLFFPITAAIFSTLYNLLIALSAAYYLPDDPLYIGLSISLYAWAGTILSICGLAGIILRHSTLITSFAHFLLIDTFVSATTRLLILQFLLESFSSVSELCSPSPLHHHRDQRLWNPQNFRHDIVTSVRWQKQNLWGQISGRSRNARCEVALGAVQILLVLVLIAVTAAQGMLAVSMRRYGKELELVQKRVLRGVEKARRSPHPDPEKAVLMGR